MRSPVERLRDILDAIERIEKYAPLGRDEFDRNELVQTWFVRQIEIIGEAVSQLPQEVREKEHDTPWRSIVAMRNLLAHGYFIVDLSEVWGVVEHDIAPLKVKVQSLLNFLEEGDTQPS